MEDEKIKRLQSQLEENKVDLFFITHPTDLLYFTGLKLSSGIFVITKQGARLFVDGRYFENCQKELCLPVHLNSVENDSLISFLVSQKEQWSRIGFDSETTSYQVYKGWEKSLSAINYSFIGFDQLMKKTRLVKTSQELHALQEAARLCTKGYEYICTKLKEGVTERELAVELEIFWLKNGSQGLSFEPIIAFGPNSSKPHHRAGNATLKMAQVVLIDIGVIYKNYHSDMTRTLFFGAIDSNMEEIYHIVNQAQKEALKLCKPGMNTKDVDAAARSYIQNQGYGSYFIHSLGHGVGLDIHELPVLRSQTNSAGILLQEGMVITIEPGVYLPNKGGVRIEDTVRITKDGYVSLTQVSSDLKIIPA